MFAHQVAGPAEFWFTDVAEGDLTDPAALSHLSGALDIPAVATMRQVHGPDVAWAMPGLIPEADALLTYTPGLGLVVRIADCVPVVLATEERDTVGVVHAGRKGLIAGVVPAAVQVLQERGRGRVSAWLGPRICGRCYELDSATAAEVSAAVPSAGATTAEGTPAADIGAGVLAQLADLDVDAHDLGGCTLEDERFFSHRRNGTAHRQAAIVVIR
ncbi:MAG TPA: polyphenol oxidase family protein [Aeromicrobium sp.]|nr:polyphenol oxidase family protein [Aeromicrobium sp.]